MQEYYQICGFRAHTGQWQRFRFDQDYKGLARVIAGPDSPLRFSKGGAVELVLGVQICGATYLLMTVTQMEAVAQVLRLHPLRNPYSATQYESLSPIHFSNWEELSKKLLTYGIKYKKGRPHDRDDSQANRCFVLTGGCDGVLRGAFEYQRVLYRISKNEIDLHKFSLGDTSLWIPSLRIFSLVFNTWEIDHRPARDRLHDPMVIDVGWTEVSIPEYNAKKDTGACVHIIATENAKLGKKAAFEHGNSEMLNQLALSSRLQDAFSEIQGPVILVVDGEERTRYALQKFGVNVSKWESGIQSLLAYEGAKNRAYYRSNDTENNDGKFSHLSQRRSRSRSPRRERNYGESSYSSRDNQRPRPPHRSLQKTSTTPHASVYIVDAQQMYIKISGDSKPSRLNEIARRLGLREGQQGSCAGNECHLLVNIWQDMAQGLSIDEQRVGRWSAAVPSSTSVIGTVESEDPNDFAPVSSGAGRGYAYDDDDDDFDDY